MNFLTSSTFRLGSLVLSTPLLYILTGIGAGSVFMIVFTRNDKTSRKIAADLVTNSLLIVLLTWKLLPVLLAPGDIFSNPLMILYVSGGTIGMMAGTILGIIYLVFKLIIFKKNTDIDPDVRAIHESPLRDILKPVLIFFVAAAVVTSLLFLISMVPRNGDVSDSSGGDRPVAPSVGSRAPDFELSDTNGDLIGLADYRGKWVILNFWATWCPPCLAELPSLSRFFEEADKDKIVLLGMNAADTEKSAGGNVRSYISSFAEEKGMTFPILLDAGGKVGAAYNVENLPTTVVISPEGIITKIKTGVADSFWLRASVGGD